VPLTNPVDPFIYRTEYDQRPEYVIVGGLVFSPLSSNYMRTQRRQGDDSNLQQLQYLMRYAKQEGLHEGRDQFVVLIARLPHPVNTYAERFVHGVVAEVNGRPIGNIADIAAATSESVDGFHVIRFMNNEDSLVIDAAAARDSSGPLLSGYGVDSASYIRDRGKETP